MSFEQTKIFHDLLKHFCGFANAHRFDTGRDRMAAEMVARFSSIHGAANVAKVAVRPPHQTEKIILKKRWQI